MISDQHRAADLGQRRIEANGVEFEILEVGSGALALCLHGFPDSAHTWRYLLPELAQIGFRAVAPFMRGYAPTGLAPDGCYELGALVADAVALHEALDGDERAVLIGSDWGAEAAYGAATVAPEKWSRLVTIGVPPLALDQRLFSDYDQLKRFFYLFFMKTQLAESVLALNEMAFLDRLWADWCPKYDASEDSSYAKQCLSEPENTRRLRSAITAQRSLGSRRVVWKMRTGPGRTQPSAPLLSRPSIYTETATAVLMFRLSATPSATSRPVRKQKASKAQGTFFMSSALTWPTIAS